MKICLVLEGSYPYTRGGVSSWVQSFTEKLPQHKFILWTIADQESKHGKFQYKLPPNITEVHENFLDSALNLRVKREANPKFSEAEKREITQLIRCQNPDWKMIFKMFHEERKNPVEFFMSEDFLEVLKEYSYDRFPFAPFSELFWTIRSMFLPFFYLVGQPIPKADLYHSVSTGYAGVLASFASLTENKPLVLTEHGIYTREREEEILRSDWVPTYYKELWISMFYMYSRFIYQTAHQVTSLFSRASLIQQELGCPPEKCTVIANGILYENFSSAKPKEENDWIDIGAIVRIAPIKDIKTMIFTFARLKQEFPNARLHIVGGVDDEEYAHECHELVEFLGVQDVLFHGVVSVPEYLEKFDFTVLTSISEGQPFALIEAMAAGRAVIATNVGCCKELIDGEPGDTLARLGCAFLPCIRRHYYKQ